ncbi:MAG: LysR family transcriptional regulator [Acidihalobacter sp.]|uniref:LysR family transcriptional regulator n=1 Tax=Acidihalobacter sp. TaxID=1872108 RepID=UPI00307DB40F
MREFNLDQLRTLVVIVEHGSFAEAARRLHLAPPTVSLHISELETRIGARLLSRTRGAVRPTAIGESLVEHARRLLADVAHVMDDMARQSKGLAGRVRIGSSTGVIAHLLPRALEILADTHPGIDVQIAVLTSHQSLERLASGALDIGIVALPQAKVAGLVIEPWRRDPILAFLKAAQENPAEGAPCCHTKKGPSCPTSASLLGHLIHRCGESWGWRIGKANMSRLRHICCRHCSACSSSSTDFTGISTDRVGSNPHTAYAAV